MWLISGGAFQGKLDYALDITGMNREDAADGLTCSRQELLGKPIINHFHLWIERMLREGQDVNALVEEILEVNPKAVIIVDELGCGIVPMEPSVREYRETTGRICCRLAAAAQEVHRVICGIGTVIKVEKNKINQ
ncbi:MAG TPA: adenosylcobinamide kinase [Clostridiales bacterium]|nr:adenosylcobinamide kinase [Clostridiales bacterium]